jgi:hypothetical protein
MNRREILRGTAEALVSTATDFKQPEDEHAADR